MSWIDELLTDHLQIHMSRDAGLDWEARGKVPTCEV